jgi:hypothetical protein
LRVALSPKSYDTTFYSTMRFTIATALSCLLNLVAALPTQPTAAATLISSTARLEIRQGGVVTAAPAVAVPGQVSPITTVQIGEIKGGVYVQVQQVYTQTFALPVDQWPTATQGSIGLGTIQGEIGVVKTKRDVMPTQLPTARKDVLTLDKLRVMMNELPFEEETTPVTRDLVLTTEEFNNILAAMPVEDGSTAKSERRDVVITKEILDKLIN